MSALIQLKQYTSVVADTGDVDSIARYHPDDATTNPSLILKALQANPDSPLVSEAAQLAQVQGCTQGQALTCLFGREIAQLVPGYVSTEVDPRLSFDCQATIAQAKMLIELYRHLGVESRRILIKIAATWEGIQAAKTLEALGIQTNITLLFCQTQALAAAQAGATLISPFVGRILDWYKTNQPERLAHGDPGVDSVTEIHQLLKSQGFSTIVMGASFRSSAQVLALAGCDKLTISPALLNELAELDTPVSQQLQAPEAQPKSPALTETAFRWQLNEDPMASEKLAEGIRLFTRDIEALEALL